MSPWLRIPLRLLTFGMVGLVALATVVIGGYYYVEPSIPNAADLRDYRPQTPLRIYSRDARLMAQYGENKRAPVAYEQIPQRVKDAFLAAEDDRFFEHSGVDYAGILRGAAFAARNLVTGRNDRVPGGSTITQQVSRTAQLVGREYDPARKFREVLLAYRIEDEFSKEEIFGLFLNTTFFGQSANGVAAAAQRYFNKELDELTLGEIAIIAGIPQGPSIMNPYNGPDRAADRRRYVLRRMYELGMITQGEREVALAEPIIPQRFGLERDLDGDYVAQMVYDWCLAKFGKTSCDTDGLVIVSTIDSRHQEASNEALRDALEAYDRNHGYRGPIGHIDISTLDSQSSELTTVLDTVLAAYPTEFGAQAAVVLRADELMAEVYLAGTGSIEIDLEAVAWARAYITDNRRGAYPDAVSDVLNAGDIVRFRRNDDMSLELAQIPDPGSAYEYVQGALVSLDPMDGAIVALNGGYSFRTEDQFNRATQALRQPGSSFKPFFYMSALAKGYTLASMINDVGISEYSESLEQRRRVSNYEGEYHGLVPVRYALAHSLNAAADQVVRDIGASYAADYLKRFGFSEQALPRNASLALGGGNVTTLELVAAYAVLANGGYAVGIRPDQQSLPEPYFVDRVYTADGEIVYDASTSVEMVCPEPEPGVDVAATRPQLIDQASELIPLPLRCAERVESPQLVYLITDVLKQVVQDTSGRRARDAFPERSDLAGKTGTTNESRDAAFAGFNADIVAVARVGFDDNRPLGDGEQGGRTAIPAWIDYMKVALDGLPDRELPRPPGITDLRINPETGLVAADCNRNVEWELFLVDNVPAREPATNCAPVPRLTPESGGDSGPVTEGSRSSGRLFE